MAATSILLNIAGPEAPGGEARLWLGDPKAAAQVSILNGHARQWRARSGGGGFSLKWAPQGRIRYRLDRADHRLAAQGMLLLNPGQPYEMDFEGPAESFCLFFSDALVREAWGDLAGGGAPAEFPNLVFRPGFAAEVAALRRELDGRGPWPCDLEARLLGVLADAVAVARVHRGEARRLPAAKPATRAHLRARLEVARSLIADGEGARLDQVALASGLSKFHLVRLFRAAFGTTPMKYAEGLRLDRAAAALRGSAVLVDEIAFGAGYDSASAFGRAFRRRFAMAPSAYRRAARN